MLRLRPALGFGLIVALAACSGPTEPTAQPTPGSTATIAFPTSSATPVASATPAVTESLPEPNLVGVHLLLDDGRNVWPVALWREHLQATRDVLGPGGYVVELVRADDLDVGRWQVFMDLCAALELRPILRLATTFDRSAGYWIAPPADPDDGYAQIADDYARFVPALNWPTDVHPILVGNEPNHGDEWGGRADPAAYARFLAEVADALHAADPGALVLNAPLDPYSPNTNGEPFINGFTYVNSESFLDGMRVAVPEVFNRLDAWASHPYPTGPLANGPWDQTYQVDLLNGAVNPEHVDPPPGVVNRGINGYEWELAKLETYGVSGLDVWITETGWRHAETVDPDASDNGRDWPGVAVVADWIDLALNGNQGRYPQWPDSGWTPWLDDPRVKAVVFFAFDGAPHEWGHTNWLELAPDGAVLGLYPLLPTPRAP